VGIETRTLIAVRTFLTMMPAPENRYNCADTSFS
jgi:hypothetical protein